VPRCGWSDLGTPTRLAQILKRLPRQGASAGSPMNPLAGFLDLSQQHARRVAVKESSASK